MDALVWAAELCHFTSTFEQQDFFVPAFYMIPDVVDKAALADNPVNSQHCTFAGDYVCQQTVHRSS